MRAALRRQGQKNFGHHRIARAQVRSKQDPIKIAYHHIVLAKAVTHRTSAHSNCSMGPRMREDDVVVCVFLLNLAA